MSDKPHLLIDVEHWKSCWTLTKLLNTEINQKIKDPSARGLISRQSGYMSAAPRTLISNTWVTEKGSAVHSHNHQILGTRSWEPSTNQKA